MELMDALRSRRACRAFEDEPVNAEAIEKLVEAAKLLGADPRAIQLRYLQTLTEIAGEKSSTIVFPLPMDLVEPMLNRLKATSP